MLCMAAASGRSGDFGWTPAMSSWRSFCAICVVCRLVGARSCDGASGAVAAGRAAWARACGLGWAAREVLMRSICAGHEGSPRSPRALHLSEGREWDVRSRRRHFQLFQWLSSGAGHRRFSKKGDVPAVFVKDVIQALLVVLAFLVDASTAVGIGGLQSAGEQLNCGAAG